MAKVPTTEEIQEWIFEEIRSSDRNPRADEIAFQVTQMQLSLHKRGVSAEEYGDALNGLIETGCLKPAKNGPFVMLTADGFARL